MADRPRASRFRFGIFEADAATGELRRQGMRIKLHSQPFQLLLLLLSRPGEILTREEICRELWPDGTFVDYDHGVNSAVNRLREALGDKAGNPRFVETVARRGYRFLAPVEPILPTRSPDASESEAESAVAAETLAVAGELPAPGLDDVRPERPAADPIKARKGFLERVLATPDDLPRSSPAVVRTLFILLQLMYLGFYVGALSNLGEIYQLLSPLSYPSQIFVLTVAIAAVLIPVRIFLVSAVLFHAPRLQEKFLRLWPVLLPLDILWALAPFLLLHHIPPGLALACMTPLVYSPFAQRSLMLMLAGHAHHVIRAGSDSV